MGSLLLCLFSTGVDELLLEFLGMLQIIILVFFFCGIETFEGFNTDIHRVAGFFFQLADPGFGNLFFFFCQIIDGQGIGMAPVDELAVGIKGVYAVQENLEKVFL